LIVVAIIGLMVGVLFPSASSGVDSLRLNEASNKLVNFFNDALNRAERREQAVEISISKVDRTLSIRSPDLGEKKLSLPQGISIAAIFPEQEQTETPEPPRRFMVYPGGTVPRVGVEIVNSRGAHRIVRVDPITGVPRIEVPEGR
jgi:type II secretory pathway pseudopilin PulG